MKIPLSFVLTLFFLEASDLHASRTKPLYPQLKSAEEHEKSLRAAENHSVLIIMRNAEEAEVDIDVLNPLPLRHSGLQEDDSEKAN